MGEQAQQKIIIVPNMAATPNQAVEIQVHDPIKEFVDLVYDKLGGWTFIAIFVLGIFSVWGGRTSFKLFRRINKAKQAFLDESSTRIKVKNE